MTTRSEERAAKRRHFHEARCLRRSGLLQAYAAWWWFLAEIADADWQVAREAEKDVTEHLMQVARGLNSRKGAQRDNAA